MRVNRILRRYGSELRLVGILTVIGLLFAIYNLVNSSITAQDTGSTLSSSSHIEVSQQLPTYTPYPTLVAPTTVQINIYINNTTPIYNEFTTNAVLQALSVYPTYSISSQPTSIPTSIITPTNLPTTTPSPTPTFIPLISLFTGKYFNNINLSGTPALTRIDSNINFQYGNSSPDTKIQNDNFSIRWDGTLNTSAGIYEIGVNHDDGMRIYIDDILIHNHWINKSASDEYFNINLSQGQHTIKIEYYEYLNGASVKFDIKKL